MAQTMLAAVLNNPGENFTLSVVEKPIPVPDDDEILVRLLATGLCHSDLSLMLQDWKAFRTAMKTVGHEGAGVVERLGSKVTSWKVGDRVGVKPISWVCHTCESCIQGMEQHCPQARFTGITMEGTYQQYISVPAIYVSHIPDDVDFADAAPIMCSGTTAYRALLSSELRVGQWAVILGGGGGVGHMVLQVAKSMGLRCIAVDGGEAKQTMCKELGADEYIDIIAEKDVVSKIKEITSGGAHGVLVASAHPSSYAKATEMLRVGGIVMCVAMPPTGVAVAGTDPNDMIGRSMTVRGTMVGSIGDCASALDLCSKGLLRPRVTRFKLKELPHAVDLLRQGKVAGRAVVDLWE